MNIVTKGLIVVSLILISFYTFSAAPAASKCFVNRMTGECYSAFGGDECYSCEVPEEGLPQGWELSKDSKCPNWCEMLSAEEAPELQECGPLKSSFCCTEAHSGRGGDCEDMVINDLENKCAFVEDINNCETLPTDWRSREEKEICAINYTWMSETLECESYKNKTTDKNDNDTNKGQDDNIALVMALSALVIVGALLTIGAKEKFS